MIYRISIDATRCGLCTRVKHQYSLLVEIAAYATTNVFVPGVEFSWCGLVSMTYVHAICRSRRGVTNIKTVAPITAWWRRRDACALTHACAAGCYEWTARPWADAECYFSIGGLQLGVPYTITNTRPICMTVYTNLQEERCQSLCCSLKFNPTENVFCSFSRITAARDRNLI